MSAALENQTGGRSKSEGETRRGTFDFTPALAAGELVNTFDATIVEAGSGITVTAKTAVPSGRCTAIFSGGTAGTYTIRAAATTDAGQTLELDCSLVVTAS